MIKLTTIWALVFGALVALSFLAGGWWVIDLASPNATVEQLAQGFLPYAAIMPLVGAIAFQMDGVYIGATWSREMRNLMLLSLATYFAAWAVLQPLFGNHGLWIALLLFQSARSIAFRLMLPKLTARTLG
ncbi:DNA-damage-inducible protein F [compost metagenome]